jgi:serine/threonine protein kinase
MIGETVSHYHVLDKLGEGGMGTVYRAQDTRLSRFVALKILPAKAVADPDRRNRFIQEARAASALNHPNIITVYDIGADFIAMEYVDGRPLDQVIGRRGLPLAEALHYGIEIADALAAAHAVGIVHRDLKPGNVMVTPKGRIKVLDFGLAKLVRADGQIAASDSLDAQSATMVESPKTEEGTIVGTVDYMSPEQAAGRKVDSRSDIFSFGSVFYEMLTGSRPFRGGDKISTLAAILQQDPRPARQILPALPPEVDRIIGRCLRKDPERRFQHMDDLRVAPQDLKVESETGVLAPPPDALRRSRISGWHIAGLGVLIAAATAVNWWLARPKPVDSLSALTRVTSDSGLTWDPALSPDGNLIAYASNRGTTSANQTNLDIWIQQVAGGEPIHLTHDPADDREPTFSPDGSQIAFCSYRDGGGIYVIPALGGQARLIAKDGQTPHFSPDGQRIAFWVGNRTVGDPAAPGSAQAFIVPVTGGPARRFHPEFSVIRYPIWAPNGSRLLFWGKLDAKSTGADAVDWWVAPVDNGPVVKTGLTAALATQGLQAPVFPSAWLPDGRVFFSARSADTSDIWQMCVDPGTGRATGLPLRLTTGTGISEQPSVVAGRDDPSHPVIRVALSGITRNTQIWSLPLDANHGKVTGTLHRLTEGPAAAEHGSLSMDGEKLVFARSRAGQRDVWIKDLKSGQELNLTPTPNDQFHPRITADGTKVCYSERNADKWSIYTMSVASPGNAGIRPGMPERLCDECRWTWQWSSDGTRILFDGGLGSRSNITVADLTNGDKATFLSHPQYNLYQSNFSPDGRWVAFFALIDSQHSRLYIAPFHPAPMPSSGASPAEWISVSTGQFWDDKPRWSPDGNLLYFISSRDGFLCLWAQPLDPVSKRPAGPPFGVSHFHDAGRSMMNVSMSTLEPSVARDQVTLNLGEVTGNIWLGTLEHVAR